MNRNTLITIIIVLVVVILGVVVYANTRRSAPQTQTSNVNMGTDSMMGSDSMQATSTDSTTATSTTDVNASAGTSSVKSFTVTGSNFTFSPKQLSVKKGDTVKITFVNSSGFHDFRIDEFNVATKKISGGNQQTVTFVADKTGNFQYYCSVGNHRAMGMWGTLTVTE